jgi:hypothetical protein
MTSLYDRYRKLTSRRGLVDHEPPAHKPDKGQFNGSCNREACQEPGATWFNDGTRKYYCRSCANGINRVNPDWQACGFKRPLCNPGIDGNGERP